MVNKFFFCRFVTEISYYTDTKTVLKAEIHLQSLQEHSEAVLKDEAVQVTAKNSNLPLRFCLVICTQGFYTVDTLTS